MFLQHEGQGLQAQLPGSGPLQEKCSGVRTSTTTHRLCMSTKTVLNQIFALIKIVPEWQPWKRTVCAGEAQAPHHSKDWKFLSKSKHAFTPKSNWKGALQKLSAFLYFGIKRLIWVYRDKGFFLVVPRLGASLQHPRGEPGSPLRLVHHCCSPAASSADLLLFPSPPGQPKSLKIIKPEQTALLITWGSSSHRGSMLPLQRV